MAGIPGSLCFEATPLDGLLVSGYNVEQSAGSELAGKRAFGAWRWSLLSHLRDMSCRSLAQQRFAAPFPLMTMEDEASTVM